MPCYSPMAAEWTGELTQAGKKKYKFVGKALDPRYKERTVKKTGHDIIMLPCGQCIGCRLDYSRQWADRMMLELQTMKSALFITLTYDNEHLPENGSLQIKHHQTFMKEIRRKFKNTKCRFFMSAEYGEVYHRPHYHYIIYGLSMEDFPDARIDGKNELGQNYYRSAKLESIWKKGMVKFSPVSWETCAYVARYTLKKLDHKGFEPEKLGITPEFCQMSRNPGIGRKYLEQNPDIMDYSTIPIKTEKTGLQVSIPKFYLRCIEESDPEKATELREARKKYSEDKQLTKLYGYEKRYDELLQDEEYATNIHTRILKKRCLV